MAESNILSYCCHLDKEDAMFTARRYFLEEEESCEYKNRHMIAAPIVVDLILYLMTINFILTTITVGFAMTIFSTRWIAKKLYQNMRRTDNHEERITKLEEK